MKTAPPVDHVHNWFELTYASYLVWPRSIMQSMPPEWQERFVKLAEDIDEAASRAGIQTPPYRVQALGERNRFARDPYASYDRGRRDVFAEKRKP